MRCSLKKYAHSSAVDAVDASACCISRSLQYDAPLGRRLLKGILGELFACT